MSRVTVMSEHERAIFKLDVHKEGPGGHYGHDEKVDPPFIALAVNNKHESDILDAASLHDRVCPSNHTDSVLAWTILNMLATVTITFTNKILFTETAFARCQFLLAAFQLALTWISLHITSSSAIPIFHRRHDLQFRTLVPLASLMALNVAAMNKSIAHCSIPIFQTIRVLLTPTVACLEFVLHGTILPVLARWALIPVCGGAVLLITRDLDLSHWSPIGQPFWPMPMRESVVDVRPTRSQTSQFGIALASASVIISAIYSIGVASYHTTFKIRSNQLLHRQSIIAALLLVSAVPFLDEIPLPTTLSTRHYLLVICSGLCACIINLSQFFILDKVSPTTATAIGHGKTVIIVLAGFMDVQGPVGTVQSLGGCVLVIVGITLFCFAHRSKN